MLCDFEINFINTNVTPTKVPNTIRQRNKFHNETVNCCP